MDTDEFQQQLGQLNDLLLRQLAALFGGSPENTQSVTSMPSGVQSFMEAAAGGEPRRCKSFVRRGGDPNVRGNKGLAALHVAAHEGQLSVIRELLELGADINATDKDGDTPLILAVLNRKDEAVELLIELGANVRHLNNKGLSAADLALMKRSLTIVYALEGASQCLQFDSVVHEKTLMTAAQEGNTRVIDFWLKNHPDRRACNHQLGQERTMAFIAALNGHLDIIQLLDKKGADFELSDDRGHTPLFCAAQNDHYEIVQFLLKKRCNVNHTSQSGRTALFSAVNNGHEDVAQLLLRNGADALHADNDGRTALESSVKQGSIPIFRMLIEAGADPRHVNDRGYDLAMSAADSKSLDMLKELKKQGLSMTQVNKKNGETALLATCQVGPGEVAQFLLKEGSDKNHQNRRGISPALRAVYNGLTDVVQILADAGADLDIPDNDGDTPILCAAQQNNLELVQFLHGFGCNLAAKNNNGKTLAWQAAKNGSVEMLEYLKDVGAMMDAPDRNGNTPLMVAVSEGTNPDVVSFLVRCGCSLRKHNQKGEKAEDIARRANQRAIMTALTQTKQEPGARQQIAEKSIIRGINLDRGVSEPKGSESGILDASFRKWDFMREADGNRQPIGEGGFGKVYKAITDKHQFVAVKVVKLRGLMSDEQVKRIVAQEKKGIEILSSVRHKHIMEFLKCEQSSNGDFLIFTELISGTSLFDLMRRQRKPFDEDGIRKFSRQICEALNFLHRRRPAVLHRDIKCSNIMLTHEGIVKLIDFGLAKEILTSTLAYSSVNQCGTLCFMAPELLDCDTDRVRYSNKSDVWAFGCAVYEMARAEPPNCRLPQGQMIRAILTRPMPGVPSASSASLKDFYAQCVARDVEARADADDLLRHQFLASK